MCRLPIMEEEEEGDLKSRHWDEADGACEAYVHTLLVPAQVL